MNQKRSVQPEPESQVERRHFNQTDQRDERQYETGLAGPQRREYARRGIHFCAPKRSNTCRENFQLSGGELHERAGKVSRQLGAKNAPEVALRDNTSGPSRREHDCRDERELPDEQHRSQPENRRNPKKRTSEGCRNRRQHEHSKPPAWGEPEIRIASCPARQKPESAAAQDE